MLEYINDPYFRVEVAAKIDNPQQAIYVAMHQDYAEGFALDDFMPEETKAGNIIVKRLLQGHRGEFGPLEHPQIIFNVGGFPHSTMQQIRTHRVGVSFDCQSLRYTGQRIYDLAQKVLDYCKVVYSKFVYRDISNIADDIVDKFYKDIEYVFYLRPSNRQYFDRKGHKYTYEEYQRREDLFWCVQAAIRYHERMNLGFSEEHCRSLIPFDVRQNWVMSANARSLMHMLDLRWKADAQLEAQTLSNMLFSHFKDWVPQIAQWYEENRAKKARLAP